MGVKSGRGGVECEVERLGDQWVDQGEEGLWTAKAEHRAQDWGNYQRS